MINDDYIINKYWKNKSILFFRYYNSNKVSEDEIIYLTNRFLDSETLLESLYRIKYKIEIKPRCSICGKIINFNLKLKRFNQYCSKACTNKNPKLIETRKQTCINKYGVDCISKSKEIQEKISNTWKLKSSDEINKRTQKSKQTSLERYGVENFRNLYKAKQTKLERYGDEKYCNPNKAKQTKLERYGDEKYCNPNKAKQTKLERYGDEKYCNPNKAKQTKLERYGDKNYHNEEKIKQTNLERYGVEYGLSNINIKEKIKQTNLERYGVDCILKLSEFRDTIKHILPEAREKAKETAIKRFGINNYNNREQYKKTCLEKYNVTHYSSTDEYKKHQSFIMSLPEIQDKRYNTMKINNTFNKSKPEDETYLLLKEKYPNVIRQYKSDIYPFDCDFYIPSLDLYIECNYHWTHGSKPFEGTPEDNIKLEQWKNKHTKYYDKAIETWTTRDINKRNTAKENNLNYIEFFSILELITWLNN